MEFRILGPLEVRDDGGTVVALGGVKPRLATAVLLMNANEAVHPERLVRALWGEDAPPSAVKSLQVYVSRLRATLGVRAIIVTTPAGYRLRVRPGELDADRFERLVAEGRQALATNLPEQAAVVLRDALALWRGRPLADLAFEDFARPQIERLDEQRLSAIELRVEADLAAGRHDEVVSELRALVTEHPTRERLAGQLMLALYRCGQQTRSLDAFQAARQTLIDQIGIEPGPQLRELHQAILTHDPRLKAQPEHGDPLAVSLPTKTLLFSELVSCPPVGCDLADARRRAGLRLLRQAVAAHGGRGIDDVQGGLLAIFKGTRSALDCAVQMQQAVARRNARDAEGRLSVRAAIHASEPAHAGDERSSTAVIVAQRLCQRAVPGQILLSVPVHAREASEQRLREVAALKSPDAAKPLATWEVVWEPAALPRFPLPPAFSARERDMFVGRESDLERLWGLYQLAGSGTRQIVLVRGDAGIGKTRLATELALRAQADGAALLYGRCDEEPLVPHQPFVEALRDYVAACPLSELVGQVGQSSGELRRLVPELGARIPELEKPFAGDPEGERYRLFDAVSALLCEAAQDRPVVVVLDDLHWADKPSLLLLRHLARYSRAASLLVVGTYREGELDAVHPLSETLADLSREDGYERHRLDSLGEAAVARLVTSHAGHEVPQLSEVIFNETDGNPFFVVEMLRHLAESDGDGGKYEQWASPVRAAEVGIPEGVREVIGRRVARLGEATQRVLSIACVAGRDFEYAVIAHMSDLDDDQLVEALDQALRARVIEELAGAGGHYTFSHALIRDTIYGELTATRRALLHRRVAASLEETHAADLEPYRAELAYHFAHAGSAHDLEKAIEYGARAGDRAVAQLAYEQAAAHYRQAASLIDTVERPRQLQRCDLMIAQGEAERRAGDPAYRQTLLDGARLAKELDDADRLARAALANNRGFFSATEAVDRERVAVLEDALDAQRPDDSAIRASLSAHLAVELVADPDWRRRTEICDAALAMARRVGDPTTLLRTLNYRFAAMWGPQTLPERLANIGEASDVAAAVEEPVLAFFAAFFGSNAAMEAGELALADRQLERSGELADRLGQPIIHWYQATGHAKRNSIAGSLDEAAKYARTALDLGRRARQPDCWAWFSLQLVVIRFLQGTLMGGRPDFLKAAEASPRLDTTGVPMGSHSVPLLVEAVHAVTLCEAGRLEHARRRFDDLMRDELADLPHDWAALAIPALASVACAQLGDQRCAERLYTMLEPHASQFVDSGPSWLGATTHYLALLATTLGNLDAADAHFATAVGAYENLGAGPWLARAQLDWARTLLARRGSRDALHPKELLTHALDAAQELGLAKVERESASLLAALSAS